VPSKIGAVSQLAQIGPILLFLVKCKCVSCFKNQKGVIRSLRRYQVSDRVIIYFLFTIGLIAGAMLALFWDHTSDVFGKKQSIAFFSCVFCLAILDCTCTIVFLTYVGNFRGNYITGLYIGEGISSLLPSLFALMQGTGDDESEAKSCTNGTVTTIDKKDLSPRFSVSVYFWLLFGTLVVSFVAFLLLEFWPSFRKERIRARPSMREIEEYQGVTANFVTQSEAQKLASERRASIKRKEYADLIILLVAITLVSL
jgi:riboflavin transporter 2